MRPRAPASSPKNHKTVEITPRIVKPFDGTALLPSRPPVRAPPYSAQTQPPYRGIVGIHRDYDRIGTRASSISGGIRTVPTFGRHRRYAHIPCPVCDDDAPGVLRSLWRGLQCYHCDRMDQDVLKNPILVIHSQVLPAFRLTSSDGLQCKISKSSRTLSNRSEPAKKFPPPSLLITPMKVLVLGI